VEVNGQLMLLTGIGNGPIDAAVHALQGVGMGTNIVTASAKALLSGVNRLGLAEGVVLESQAA